MTFRPKIDMISQKDVERIISSAYEILQTTGIKFEHDEALNILHDHGANIDFPKKIAYLNSDIIDRCVKSVPSVLDFYNFQGDKAVTLKDDNVNFVLDSAPVNILDSHTKKIREATTKDMIDIIKLVESLEYVTTMTACVTPNDIPVSICDVVRFYLTLLHTNKPVFGGAFSIDGLLAEFEMLSILSDGEKNMQEKPRVFMAANPSAPLNWTNTSAGNLVDCAKYNIPIMIIPIPLSGATTPVTLAGTVVEHAAECLGGVVLSQCVRQNAPIIYGGGSTLFDMRKGTNAEGAIETKMMTIAQNAQVGKYFGFPTAANIGRNDSNQFDAQAATESGFGMFLGALAGINMIRGVGMLSHGGAASLEKMAYDNEVCGMIHRFIDGISINEETIALDFIKEHGHSGDQILSSMHTFNNFRKEQFIPSDIIDRGTQNDDQKDIFLRAQGKVQKLISDYKPIDIGPQKKENMKRVLKEFSKKKNVKVPDFVFEY